MYDKSDLSFWFERSSVHRMAEKRISELEVLVTHVFYLDEEESCVSYADDSLSLAVNIRFNYKEDSWFSGLADRIENLVAEWKRVTLPMDEN